MTSTRREVRLPGCAPVGDLAPWPMLTETCACGVTLYPKPVERGRDWIWVTADGEAYRDDAPAALREDPVKWWADLARADIGGYSNLKAATDLNAGYWWHPHRPDRGPGQDPRIGPDRTPPFCCTSPMRATPYGWECRRSGTLVGYASPLVLPEPTGNAR